MLTQRILSTFGDSQLHASIQKKNYKRSGIWVHYH